MPSPPHRQQAPPLIISYKFTLPALAALLAATAPLPASADASLAKLPASLEEAMLSTGVPLVLMLASCDASLPVHELPLVRGLNCTQLG